MSSPKEADDNVPADTLVCDLHYENSWDARRRYQTSCSIVGNYTVPCTGTYACICKHGAKEFYRVHKTMPVVPKAYSGLASSLADAWIDPPAEVLLEDDGGNTVIVVIIIISAVAGTLILCCVAY